MFSKRIHRGSFALSLLLVISLLLSACGGETPAPAATATTGEQVAPTTGTEATATTPAGDTGTEATATTPAGDTGTEATATTPAGDAGGDRITIKIGFAFITSGDNAVYGNSQRAAAEMAVEEINAGDDGPRIEAIFEDTAGKPDQAITVFQKFINSDQVHAIIGPTLSNEARSSDPVAQEAGVPVLGVSNTAGGITDIGDYIFRNSLAEFQVIPETIRQAKEKLNLTKVSLLYASDDAFSKSGADVFRAELQKNNIQILSEQTFATADTDYRTQLTQIKGENPDAIVVSALANPAQTILQQARRDVGIDPKVHIIGGNGFNSPAVVKAAGDTAEGLVVGAAWNLNATDELSQQFIKNFNAKHGRDPDQFAAQAYAGVYILHFAASRADLEGVELADARDAIRAQLNNIENFGTVLGPFGFTDKRDANHPPVVQIVRNGVFEILK
ncbi:MAG: ABC transporter substrate-binding protein [Chloroflexota bacterium]|nr:ABC transporter substrate-binding protein [Chloroflexota bacterium]MDQ5865513.1 ABC transporter substrate-binding protein [Chloroflexota bacterium]